MRKRGVWGGDPGPSKRPHSRRQAAGPSLNAQRLRGRRHAGANATRRGVRSRRVRLPRSRAPAALPEVRERARQAAGRLAALKPQERRTIGLQAAGCPYAEIQAITGWTYTKLNRCLTEGRAALSKLRPLPDVA